MKTTAFLLTMLVPAVVSAQQKPTTGYAPLNGLKMDYEVHGSGDPLVLLHGSFMTITNNWTRWIGELSKTRKVIAVEMQGHGRTADIKRDFSYENLADDVAALLDHLKIPSADLIGYSMGGGVAMQCAIRHPEKVRKVVSISARFRQDGLVKEGLDAFPKLTPEAFKDSPIEIEYKKLSPTPDKFADLVNHIKAMASTPFDFGADKLRATRAPMFFIHGDADGVRLEHIAEMFRLKGGEVHGDIRPRSASRLAILPDTTHVTLMDRMAHDLVHQGRRVRFTTCSLLVQGLLATKRDLKLSRALKRLASYEVLLIDDLGYVQQDRAEMEVLFTLLADRYERGSVWLTSNLPFSKWEAIFKDPMTTAAAIDRLVHHSVIVELNLSSYRLEHAKKAKEEAPEEVA